MNAVASHHIKFISHSDQGGRGDGVQVMVNRGFAYMGHGFSNGITVIDVRDPKNPQPVNFLPARRIRALTICKPTTICCWRSMGRACGPCRSVTRLISPARRRRAGGSEIHQRNAGLRSVAARGAAGNRFPAARRIGPHRIWYVGGRYAYVSVHLPEFTDHVLVIVDMAEPARPQVVGQILAARHVDRRRRDADLAEGPALRAASCAWSPVTSPTRAWRDGGLAIINVADPRKPTLVCHRNWDPPFGGGTHSPLPLPDRDLLVVADEANFADCSLGLRYIWMFDVREPANPVSIATMPVPTRPDYCKKGGNFGPHNLWENRPGAFQSSQIIFATLHNAGVRVYDIANPFQPREIGYFVPPDPERMFDPRPNRPQVIQSCDCFVDAQGVMYLTDSNAGLNILQFEGG